MNLTDLAQNIAEFARARDWEKFHSPKNLSMALTREASELMEIFQWLTEEESRQLEAHSQKEMVREELADVLIYLIRLADVLGVDLEEALTDKIRANEKKYPVSLSRGKATKYTRLKK